MVQSSSLVSVHFREAFSHPYISFFHVEALYEDLHVQSIKFEVYHHFSGLSFIVEVNFWHPLITVVSCDLFTSYTSSDGFSQSAPK